MPATQWVLIEGPFTPVLATPPWGAGSSSSYLPVAQTLGPCHYLHDTDNRILEIGDQQVWRGRQRNTKWGSRQGSVLTSGVWGHRYHSTPPPSIRNNLPSRPKSLRPVSHLGPQGRLKEDPPSWLPTHLSPGGPYPEIKAGGAK